MKNIWKITKINKILSLFNQVCFSIFSAPTGISSVYESNKETIQPAFGKKVETERETPKINIFMCKVDR